MNLFDISLLTIESRVFSQTSQRLSTSYIPKMCIGRLNREGQARLFKSLLSRFLPTGGSDRGISRLFWSWWWGEGLWPWNGSICWRESMSLTLCAGMITGRPTVAKEGVSRTMIWKRVSLDYLPLKIKPLDWNLQNRLSSSPHDKWTDFKMSGF